MGAAWLLAVGLFLGFRVLVPPVIGLADNGDGWRARFPFGLEPVLAEKQWPTYHHVILEHSYGKTWNPPYPTTELVFVGAAVALDRSLSDDGRFDLRWLGVVHLLAFLIAAGLVLTATRRLPPLARAITWALLAFVLTDAAYAVYFNSFYTEPASLIGLLATIGAAGLWLERPGSLGRAGLLLGAALCFVGAKLQNVPLGLLLGGGLLAATAFAPRGSGLPACRRVFVGVGLALALLAFSSWMLARSPDFFRRQNLYNSVFHELLPHSPSPRADLEELGLDPELVRWSGTDAFAKGTGMEEPELVENFHGRISQRHLLAFYLRHPMRLASLLVRAASKALPMRPAELGTRVAADGFPERSPAGGHAAWSDLKASLAPAALPVIGLVIAFGLLSPWLFRSIFRPRVTAPLAGLGIAAAAAFAIAVIGEGEYELTRHLFTFHALFDVLVVGSVGLGVAVLESRLASRREPSVRSGTLAGT